MFEFKIKFHCYHFHLDFWAQCSLYIYDTLLRSRSHRLNTFELYWLKCFETRKCFNSFVSCTSNCIDFIQGCPSMEFRVSMAIQFESIVKVINIQEVNKLIFNLKMRLTYRHLSWILRIDSNHKSALNQCQTWAKFAWTTISTDFVEPDEISLITTCCSLAIGQSYSFTHFVWSFVFTFDYFLFCIHI